VPPISTLKFEPLVNETLPVLRIPALLPGATLPPLATLTGPDTVPVPLIVPLLLTLSVPPLVKVLPTVSANAPVLRVAPEPIELSPFKVVACESVTPEVLLIVSAPVSVVCKPLPVTCAELPL